MGSTARAQRRARARAAAKAGAAPPARRARRTAAPQRAARRRPARRRLLLASSAIAVVIVVAVTLVALRLAQPPPGIWPKAGARTTARVQRQIASIPPGTFNTVASGTATGLTQITGQPPLTSAGKPELLYVGAQYCPFCAAERWALAAAVSRFGRLSGISLIRSSATDAYPGTPTLSFARVKYTSRYLAFVPVEWFSETPDAATPTGYSYLQHPTAQQRALLDRYAAGSFPFVDIGNRYAAAQAQYLPSALIGLTWSQVAAAMHNAADPVGKDIDGAANMITAGICTLTRGQPAAVCTSPGVRAAARAN